MQMKSVAGCVATALVTLSLVAVAAELLRAMPRTENDSSWRTAVLCVPWNTGAGGGFAGRGSRRITAVS